MSAPDTGFSQPCWGDGRVSAPDTIPTRPHGIRCPDRRHRGIKRLITLVCRGHVSRAGERKPRSQAGASGCERVRDNGEIRAACFTRAMPSQLRVTFARLCFDTRTMLDITQQTLADAVGVSRAHIAAVEGGRANPSLDLVARIADRLGIELDLVARQPLSWRRTSTTSSMPAVPGMPIGVSGALAGSPARGRGRPRSKPRLGRPARLRSADRDAPYRRSEDENRRPRRYRTTDQLVRALRSQPGARARLATRTRARMDARTRERRGRGSASRERPCVARCIPRCARSR